MTQETIEKLIRGCMDEAQKAIDSGNTPFGCILTDLDGKIITKSHNEVVSTSNPTAHAEICAIASLSKQLGKFELTDYALFANAESCPMCMACALRAGIQNFFFGAGTGASTNPKISVKELAEKAKQQVEIQSGILEYECSTQIKKGYAQLSA